MVDAQTGERNILSLVFECSAKDVLLNPRQVSMTKQQPNHHCNSLPTNLQMDPLLVTTPTTVTIPPFSTDNHTVISIPVVSNPDCTTVVTPNRTSLTNTPRSIRNTISLLTSTPWI